MKNHFGAENVTAKTYKEVTKQIPLKNRKLVIVDEVDSALIDRCFSI